ncbi:SpaH/EbpB family LPXTG-anchored major pilin [Leucobacter sp. USHLN154]|uniref:SpaH/EbpB family LPXTG-anchored major pilin n=1 Tax=Leucobacter sp. USHLN154 TaxID=3081269 RepID=UPI003018606F
MTSAERRPHLRRALAAVGAFALALLGTVAVASAAQATDPPDISNIVGTSGSLTIHKHAGDPGTAGDGGVITSPDSVDALGEGLDGVQFSLQRVTFAGKPIDLTTADGWDQAQDATPANAGTAPYGLVAASTPSVTTAGGGLAVADDLPYGLYLVTETDAGPNPIVSPVQPFLVSVPYPEAADSSWLYDVHVYPKNKLNATEPTKTVAAPEGLVLGSTVKWTVTAPIPELGVGDTYRKFIVTDQLDPRLTLSGVAVSLDGEALALGTDYTLQPASLPATNGPNAVVTLTPAGLEQLAGKTAVTVELSTQVASLGSGETGGKVQNKAVVNVNDSVRETDRPQTNWGPLQIVKTAAQEPNRTLSRAEFTLHETKGGPEVSGVGLLTSDSDGIVSVAGLWVGNGATLSKNYWVRETQAPAGYVLPSGDAAWTEVTVNAGDLASVVSVSIQNTQQRGPNLPLTGSSGGTVFMAGGAALLLIAIGSALVATKRKRNPLQ